MSAPSKLPVPKLDIWTGLGQWKWWSRGPKGLKAPLVCLGPCQCRRENVCILPEVWRETFLAKTDGIIVPWVWHCAKTYVSFCSAAGYATICNRPFHPYSPFLPLGWDLLGPRSFTSLLASEGSTTSKLHLDFLLNCVRPVLQTRADGVRTSR
jgi:hypothetical protein